jgi:hypothetical protein
MVERHFPIRHLVLFLVVFVQFLFITRADAISVGEPSEALQQKQPVRALWTNAHIARQISKSPDSPKDKKDPGKEEVAIEGIRFQVEEDGSEKVFILMNRSYWPKVFVLEGDKPRIVIDFENVFSWEGRAKISVKGNLIRQIRTHLRKTQGKLRVVLDLDPDVDYVVRQVFYEGENIICLTVSRQKKGTQNPK